MHERLTGELLAALRAVLLVLGIILDDPFVVDLHELRAGAVSPSRSGTAELCSPCTCPTVVLGVGVVVARLLRLNLSHDAQNERPLDGVESCRFGARVRRAMDTKWRLPAPSPEDGAPTVTAICDAEIMSGGAPDDLDAARG